jgi:hypothetical protein
MSYGFRDVHAISKCHDATVRTIFDVDVNDTVTFTDWDVLSGPFSEEPGGGKGGNNIDDDYYEKYNIIQDVYSKHNEQEEWYREGHPVGWESPYSSFMDFYYDDDRYSSTDDDGGALLKPDRFANLRNQLHADYYALYVDWLADMFENGHFDGANGTKVASLVNGTAFKLNKTIFFSRSVGADVYSNLQKNYLTFYDYLKMKGIIKKKFEDFEDSPEFVVDFPGSAISTFPYAPTLPRQQGLDGRNFTFVQVSTCYPETTVPPVIQVLKFDNGTATVISTRPRILMTRFTAAAKTQTCSATAAGSRTMMTLTCGTSRTAYQAALPREAGGMQPIPASGLVVLVFIAPASAKTISPIGISIKCRSCARRRTQASAATSIRQFQVG